MSKKDMIEKMMKVFWDMPDDHSDFFKDKVMSKILEMQIKCGMKLPCKRKKK